MIFVMDMFATPQPTNKTVPTGGVQIPIHKLTININPKCKGSIPIAVTIGKNIGVKMRIAVVYALIITMLVYKEIRIKDIPQIFLDTSITTGVVML